jgi:hypothetical protein
MRAKLVTLTIVLAACGGNGATTTTPPAGSTTSSAGPQTTTTVAATTTTTLSTDPVEIVAVTPLPLEMVDFSNAPVPNLGVTMALMTASPLKAAFVAANGFPGDCLGFTLWAPDYTTQYTNGHVDLTPGGCDGAEFVFTDDQILVQDENLVIVDFGDTPEGPFVPAFQVLDAGFETGYYSKPIEPIDPAGITAVGSGLFTLFGGETLRGSDWGFYPLPPATPGDCVPDGPVTCLNNDRFKVQVGFVQGGGMAGGTTPANPLANPLPSQGDTGFFWFFDSANVDLVVKVLNGCSANGHYWVFVGDLTGDRGSATVTIEDTATDEPRTYETGPGDAIADTQAFATCP